MRDRSVADVKPIQALDAYVSLATTTVLSYKHFAGQKLASRANAKHAVHILYLHTTAEPHTRVH
jgi:hypothetical protein